MDDSLQGAKSWFGKLSHQVKRFFFGTKAQHAFLEDFYTLVNDGIPPNRALEMMADSTRGLPRTVATSLVQTISEGQPLADGMHEWFTPNIVELARVGEEGGALAETLKSGINSLGQRSAAIGAFAGALAYPLMVIAVASSVIVYLNGSIFDQFRALKPQNQWPEAGQQLVSIAVFIRHWWWSTIVGLVVFVVILRRIMTHYVGGMRPTLDAIPPFSFYRRFVAAQFLETLGLLVSNGIVFKSALVVMQNQASPYLSSHLITMEHLLSTGKSNIADVLATGLISDTELMRLRVMAEVKGFEHGLIRMGERGTTEAMNTMKLIAKLSGGALLLVGAYLVLSIVRGIYLTGMAMGS